MAPLLAPLLLLMSALPSGLASDGAAGPYPPLSDAASAVLGDVRSFADLRPCEATSAELARYGPDDALAPCLLYDIRDYVPAGGDGGSPGRRRDQADEAREDDRVESGDSTTSGRAAAADPARSLESEGTAEVSLVQVTPSNCNNHRDGAVTSVGLLNSSNAGRGFGIGYRSAGDVSSGLALGREEGDRSVKFRLVSIVGGNPANVGNDVFTEVHVFLLDSAIRQIGNAAFILGSCSFASWADKPVALENRKVVLSQVGPPGFYDPASNPYVFGIHVNSDTYPLPALSALTFRLQAEGQATSTQQVRALYRDRSEFFKSTCESAVNAARQRGFDVTAIEYNPDGDDDGDGVPNSQDDEHVRALADRLCPPSDGDGTPRGTHHPAIFACVNQEVDVVIGRLRENGCRPVSAWFTTATWGWATANPETIPYFQGGGQWHENFKYGDEFFVTGQAVLDYGLEEYGYLGNYDHVVSYAMPMFLAKLLQSYFRVQDSPDVAASLGDGNYEIIRRHLMNINVDTIFGPVSFNEYQRNNGRGAAGTQWIPASSVSSSSSRGSNEDSGEGETTDEATVFKQGCVSPLDQANTAIVIPSPSSSDCDAGSYVNRLSIESEPALLATKCAACPADTFMSVPSSEVQCAACPEGSSTTDESGSTRCVTVEQNLIGGLEYMGYVLVAISWSMSLGYLAWVMLNRKNSVVKISQPEFLVMMCVGAMISSSAIIPWSNAQASVGGDVDAASRNCMTWPWLYSIGWTLMFSSLTAKSVRLNKVATNSMNMQRKTVNAKDMYFIVVIVLLLDIAILTAWTVVDPLQWTRSVVGTSVAEAGVVTIDSFGKCGSSGNMFAFLGPIIAVHVTLIAVTLGLLWKVRNIGDRYQEFKYVAIASVYICELLLLGVPILVAVQDSAPARYIVITGVIFLSDTGVMAFIFLPKIKYAKEGLPEGMSVVESMNLPSTVSQQQRRKSYGISRFSRASTGSDPGTERRTSAGSEPGTERRTSADLSPSNNSKVISSEASNEGNLDVSQVPEMEERQLSQSSASGRRVTFEMSESSDGDISRSALGENPGDVEAVKAKVETVPKDDQGDV